MAVTASPGHGQSRGNDGTATLGKFNPPPPPPQLLPPPPPQEPSANQPVGPTGPGSGPARQRRWRDMIDALLDMIAPRALSVRRWIDDPLTTGFNNPDLVEPAVPRGGA
jgi:hypothetical protein